jgi:hypothetical protein
VSQRLHVITGQTLAYVDLRLRRLTDLIWKGQPTGGLPHKHTHTHGRLAAAAAKDAPSAVSDAIGQRVHGVGLCTFGCGLRAC